MRLQSIIIAFIGIVGALGPACADEFVKLLVKQDRMYAVPLNALTANGIDLSGIAQQNVNIYHAGKTVPIKIEGLGANGELTADSTIVFWGEFPRGASTPKNPVTRENAYLLRWDLNVPPHRFQEVPLERTNPDASPRTTWRRTRRLEQDLYLAHYQHYHGAPTDRVMWTRLMAPPRENPQSKVRFDLSDLDITATGEISLRAYLWGTSALPEEPDHRWRVVLNGNDIGVAEWDGNTSCHFTSQVFPESVLRTNDNELTFVSIHTGETVDAALLDWLDLTYTARLDAGTGDLEFVVPAEYKTPIRFNTDAELPSVYSREGYFVNPEASIESGYTMQLPAQLKGVPLRAISTQAMALPERIMSRRTAALPTSADRLDYIVIAHAAFMDALQPLMAHRRNQGLRAALVDVEDLYDAFTDGMFSADAIRLFLRGLLRNSPSGDDALKYVFLVGDASYDYFAIRGNDENFVPTWHTTLDGELQLPVSTPTLALEDAFVYPDQGDQLPRAAIGRLPAKSLETVEAYVRKILDYESQCDTQRPRGLFIAAHGFEPLLDRLARSSQIQAFYASFMHGVGNEREDLPIPDKIAEAFNQGLDTLYFVGHGASFMWRTGPDSSKHTTDVFTSKHVPGLRNAGRYPIVFAATCYSTLFDAPLNHKSYSDSGVGVHLVEVPDAGAIAIVGQASKIPVGAADLFSREMLESLSNSTTERLGDAFLHVKRNSELRLNPYVKGIVIIGDPALRVGKRFHRGET